MPTLPEAVATLRSFLATPDAPATPVVRLAAQHYADAWARAAHRLHIVTAHLDAGLVWEAVTLAEESPALVELHEPLLFPEHRQWPPLAERNDLPRPEGELTTAEFQRLHRAYLKADAIRSGVTRLHRLVLARASTFKRLSCLRGLRYADPANAVWKEEIRRLEARRLAELSDAFDQAERRNDQAAILALYRELRADNWLAAPDDALLRRVDDARAAIARAAMHARYREIADAVLGARSREEAECLKNAVDDWNEVQSLYEPPPPETAEAVEEAFGWYADTIRRRRREAWFDEGVRRLEFMLERGDDQEALEKLLRALEATGRNVPEPLLLGVKKRRETIDLMARRRTLTRIVAVVLPLLVAAGLAGWGFRTRQARIADEQRRAELDDQEREATRQRAHDEEVKQSQETAERQAAAFAEKVGAFRTRFDAAPLADYAPDLARLERLAGADVPETALILRELRDHIEARRREHTAQFEESLRTWRQSLDRHNARLEQGAGIDPAEWKSALDTIHRARENTEHDFLLPETSKLAINTLWSRAQALDRRWRASRPANARPAVQP